MRELDGKILASIRAVLASYDELAKANYKKATLADVASKWSAIRAEMIAIADAACDPGAADDTSQRLCAHARRHCASYDFGPELDTMDGLYAGDAARVRAIGLKIAESLEDNGLIGLFADLGRG